MFHTGDLGYRDEEGRLHYAGRRQDRIRRRGENMSAAELEFIALGHPDVLEAAAFGVPGRARRARDQARRGARARAELDLAEYHDWLEERLPRYMVPRFLELRDEFPKTPSEKVQKHRLIEAALDRPRGADLRAGRPCVRRWTPTSRA